MTQVALRLALADGREAHVVESDGERATVKSPDPYPPGATLSGALDGVDCAFQLKVRNCRRDGDWFIVEGRVQNATREMRRHLTADAAQSSLQD